ncbi:MAG: hypothetical protein H6707_05630 [Deltaproteobacteria bacterium]|nr:hypothetical protein [Deltaproteobacteria bacterium]
MSGHPHVVYTDPLGRDPEFRRDLFALVARAINALRKRSGHCFAIANHNTMVLVDEGAQLEAMAYVAAQPVAAGAVRYGYQWPGVRSKVEEFDKLRRVRRPNTSFFRNDTLPEHESLMLVPPPGIRGEKWYVTATIRAAIVSAEQNARAAHARSGRPFEGRRAVRRTSCFRQPNSLQPSRRLNPRIKCHDLELRKAAKAALSAFWCAYYGALFELRRGNRTVRFPHGTWRLRVYSGVECDSG